MARTADPTPDDLDRLHSGRKRSRARKSLARAIREMLPPEEIVRRGLAWMRGEDPDRSPSDPGRAFPTVKERQAAERLLIEHGYGQPQQSIKIEAELRGRPGEGEGDGYDPDRLSVDELAQLRALRKKATQRVFDEQGHELAGKYLDAVERARGAGAGRESLAGEQPALPERSEAVED